MHQRSRAQTCEKSSFVRKPIMSRREVLSPRVISWMQSPLRYVFVACVMIAGSCCCTPPATAFFISDLSASSPYFQSTDPCAGPDTPGGTTEFAGDGTDDACRSRVQRACCCACCSRTARPGLLERPEDGGSPAHFEGDLKPRVAMPKADSFGPAGAHLRNHRGDYSCACSRRILTSSATDSSLLFTCEWRTGTYSSVSTPG